MHVSRVLERAFKIGHCDEICRAVGVAAKLYSVVDIERKTGIRRETIYRSFVGGLTYPKLNTMVLVLGAMGFKLQIESKSGFRARPRRGYRSEKAIRRTD
jgi:probable addiction module antidote protein